MIQNPVDFDHVLDNPGLRKQVLEFHRSTHLTLSEYMSDSVNQVSLDNETLSALESFSRETSFFPPSSAIDLPNKNQPEARESTKRFSEGLISSQKIFGLLSKSFSANTKSGKRPYPSAGALYPIEIFLWLEGSRLSDSDLGTGIYHYLPVSHKLESLRLGNDDNLRLSSIWQGGASPNGTPNFALLYFINLRRALCKYRRRGYRLALIESGLIADTFDRVARYENVSTRLWAGFDDYRITKNCGLVPNLFLPAIVQLVGVEN